MHTSSLRLVRKRHSYQLLNNVVSAAITTNKCHPAYRPAVLESWTGSCIMQELAQFPG
jgi:hypothetical protein